MQISCPILVYDLAGPSKSSTNAKLNFRRLPHGDSHSLNGHLSFLPAPYFPSLAAPVFPVGMPKNTILGPFSPSSPSFQSSSPLSTR